MGLVCYNSILVWLFCILTKLRRGCGCRMQLGSAFNQTLIWIHSHSSLLLLDASPNNYQPNGDLDSLLHQRLGQLSSGFILTLHYQYWMLDETRPSEMDVAQCLK